MVRADGILRSQNEYCMYILLLLSSVVGLVSRLQLSTSVTLLRFPFLVAVWPI